MGPVPQERSLVLEAVSDLLYPSVLVLSVYLLFAGHNQPGGGFVGGLVAGLGVVLRYVAGGRAALQDAAPVDPRLPLGMGLLLAGATGVVPWLFGRSVLESAIVEFDVPVVGHVKLVSALAFDIGVYLVVIGLVLHLLSALGAGLDQQKAGP
jgi:multicomponent Na+:H+ antiporter subunit A